MTDDHTRDDNRESEVMSPAEYLVRERAARCRSEYVGGEVRALAGASERHNLIMLNVADVRRKLAGRDCRTYVSDMNVFVEALDLYCYPDVAIVCGPRRFRDEKRDALLNPTVIVEVMSDPTEAYDRGEKFRNYRACESLRECVLVSQEEPYVERYVRRGGGTWEVTEHRGFDAAFQFESMNTEMRLAEIYDRVFDEG